MALTHCDRTVAGVDGCRAGWIAVIVPPGREPSLQLFPTFSALLDALPDDAAVAVDMPIGLPETTGRGGRGPEALVRPLLGARQSSVFSIPSRTAVHAWPEPFTTLEHWYAGHRRASAVAHETSAPPRGVSIQAFAIFPKIREIDAVLRARPDLRHRIRESHPELAFWRLNGRAAMALPKKIKGAVNPAGMSERRALLCAHGYDPGFLAAPPRGASEDDCLDAAAMALVALGVVRGEAISFPDPPGEDRHGIPVAIWC